MFREDRKKAHFLLNALATEGEQIEDVSNSGQVYRPTISQDKLTEILQKVMSKPLQSFLFFPSASF